MAKWGYKMLNDDLSIRHNRFVADLLVHGDQTMAYRASFDCSTMKDGVVRANAAKLAKLPHIATAISNSKQLVVDRAMMSVVEVMQEYVDIVTADATKLIQWRQRCCRHCHGDNFDYQWRNEKEWCDAVVAAQEWNARKSAKVAPKEMPSEAGGYGFNARLPPHDHCPYCWGDGEGYVWIADTRNLRGKEKKLFAGVKQTPGGVQILMRDQDAALKNLAAIMGMFVERLQVTGANGAPIATMQLPNDPIEASRVYQALMKAPAPSE